MPPVTRTRTMPAQISAKLREHPKQQRQGPTFPQAGKTPGIDCPHEVRKRLHRMHFVAVDTERAVENTRAVMVP